MGGAASSIKPVSTRTSEAAGGSQGNNVRHRQQQPPPQPQQDTHSRLTLVLDSLDGTYQQDCARGLHRTSRGGRGSAIATIKHLSLTRYEAGRRRAGLLKNELERELDELDEEPGIAEDVAAAVARAAAAPTLPWSLLADVAAARALTSLQLGGEQAVGLLSGPPAAAAAAAAAAMPSLLSNLRGLNVEDLQEPQQEAAVARLVDSCSGLTQLSLVLAGLNELDDDWDATSAAAATSGVSSVTAAPAAAAAVPPPPPPPAAAAGAAGAAGGVAGCQLRHLEVVGGPSWAVNKWVRHGAAAGLTSLHLMYYATFTIDMSLLAACPGLQQLQLSGVDESRYGSFPGEALAQQLTGLKALTRLVVWSVTDVRPLSGLVPAAVWQLTQLRHLHLFGCWQMETLPDAFSSMRHLTHLSIEDAGLAELPHQLGAWLPQLQVLEVGSVKAYHARSSRVADISLGLTQLTHLDVSSCSISSVSGVEHLVQLKRLCMQGNPLQPPFKALSKLTALQHLAVSVTKGSAVVVPAPLPRLHTLELDTDEDPVPVLRQLLGAAQCLTQLVLQGLGPGGGIALQQLGALPALQVLSLTDCRQGYSYVFHDYQPLSTWLQQQQHVTSLVLDLRGQRIHDWIRAKSNGPGAYYSVGPRMDGLPPHLERLQLHGSDSWELPPCLEGSTSLRVLVVCKLRSAWLPDWAASLTAVEEVFCDPTNCEEGLAQLPLLRRVWTGDDDTNDSIMYMSGLLQAAPHLCWAK